MLEIDSSSRSGRERLASFLGIGPGRGDALRPLAYLSSAAMVVLALGCGLLIERFIGLQSILLVFLIAVIGAAVTRSRRMPEWSRPGSNTHVAWVRPDIEALQNCPDRAGSASRPRPYCGVTDRDAGSERCAE